MKGFHKPTVMTTVVIVVVAFLAYHILLGRKSKG